MDGPIKVLIVEDVATDAELIQMELESASINFIAHRVETRKLFRDFLESFVPDIILSDYTLPSFSALEALKIKNEINPHIPFILVTGAQTEEIAVECIKKGADDYILKSSLTRLPTSIENAIKKKSAERQHQRSLEEIRTREEKYRNLFENSLVGMFRATLPGCRFMEVNEKAKEILGTYRIEGMHFDDFGWGNDSGKLSDSIMSSGGRIQDFEVQVTKPDGSSVWISISARAYHQEGLIEGVFHDITQSKSSLIEMERANYELDRFAYHASHDLRAPLRALEGLLLAALEEESREEIHPILNMMQQSTAKMDKLIGDLLMLAQNKKSEARIVFIDFAYELKECLAQLAYSESYSRVRIHSSINQNCLFCSDAVRLRIILNNIISNAIKYHRYDQPDPYIAVEISVSEDKAEIQVKDNGSGIAQKHIDKIFDMFYRANKTSEGSGLGLFLVKTTMEKLGGSIHVESEAGQGTTFNIRIPNNPITRSMVVENSGVGMEQ